MIHASAWLTSEQPIHGLENEQAYLLPVSCGYRSVDPAEQPLYAIDRPSGRLDYQLIYVQSGEISFCIDHKSFIASAGQIVIIRPHAPHHYQYGHDKFCAVRWLHCTGSYVQSLLFPLVNQKTPVVRVGQSKRLTELFGSILLELQRKDPEYVGVATGLTLELLHYMLRKRTTQAETAAAHPHDERIDRSISIMREQYMRPWTSEELAAQVNLSPSRYIHLFSEMHHVSPLKFLNSIRLSMAQEFLGVHSLSIADVSRMSGFQSQQYFSRLFSKAFGMSPSEYRKQSEG